VLKKLVIAILVIIPAVWFGLAIYVMSSESIEGLVLCATKDDKLRIPKSLCEYYLFHFRGTKNEIKELEQGEGLPFVVLDNAQQVKYLDFLLNNGFDINKVSQLTGFAPLHIAVLQSKSGIIKYLLEHGADPTTRSGNNAGQGSLSNLTPLELAQRMLQNNPGLNQASVIQELSKHLKTLPNEKD